MATPLDLSKKLVIGELPARWARKTPDKEAFVFADKRYTYDRFNQRVNQLAHGLLGLEINKGDKVAVLFTNGMEIMECYFALAKIGAVMVPLNFRLTGRELIYQINQSDAKGIIFNDMFMKNITAIKSDLSQGLHYICAGDKEIKGATAYEQLVKDSPSKEPHIPVNEDDPAIIMYTSGTTGKPKGAVLTHKNQLMDAINFLIEINLRSDDRALCVTPLFHVAAIAVCLKLMFVGGTTVIVKDFLPEDILKVMDNEKISIMFLVPAMWILLLEEPNISDYDTRPLRIGLTGAATMPTEVKGRLMKQFPKAGIYDIFGQSEMSPCTTMLKAEDAIRKPGSVGQRMINVEARIVDNNDLDVPLGHVGEIVYRGPTVMKEYYKNPQATAEAMTGGWFHSGDLVREDEEGFLYVVDRKKDMIISGGENIYAAEIEDLLYTHPKILEAAVIGVPDPKWGENVKAIVVPKPNETLIESEIINYCKNNLAGYKKPKSIVFVESLPRNQAGKILKYVLRKKY